VRPLDLKGFRARRAGAGRARCSGAAAGLPPTRAPNQNRLSPKPLRPTVRGTFRVPLDRRAEGSAVRGIEGAEHGAERRRSAAARTRRRRGGPIRARAVGGPPGEGRVGRASRGSVPFRARLRASGCSTPSGGGTRRGRCSRGSDRAAAPSHREKGLARRRSKDPLPRSRQAVRVCVATGGDRVTVHLEPESLGKINVVLTRTRAASRPTFGSRTRTHFKRFKRSSRPSDRHWSPGSAAGTGLRGAGPGRWPGQEFGAQQVGPASQALGKSPEAEAASRGGYLLGRLEARVFDARI